MIMTTRIVQFVDIYFKQDEFFFFLIRINVLESAMRENENVNLVSKLCNQ